MATETAMGTDRQGERSASADPLYELRQVRKTYDAPRRIPASVFRECRLPAEQKPTGPGWRMTCGRYRICRQGCPRCWSLSIETMTLRRGRTSAILGHSGSGKTSLLYLLALLEAPDADTENLTIRFAAGDPARLDFTTRGWIDEHGTRASLDRVRRARFGFVFQAGHLSSHLTAIQNVGLAPALAGLPPWELRQRDERILERIDFPPDRYHALPRHLSGGEYQRIAVARALASDPEVLFADEPTGNLDPVTGRAVMQLLASWRAEDSRRSLVLVTHNLEHALELSDDLFVLSGGEVALRAEGAGVSSRDIEAALRRRPAAEIAALPTAADG